MRDHNAPRFNALLAEHSAVHGVDRARQLAALATMGFAIAKSGAPSHIATALEYAWASVCASFHITTEDLDPWFNVLEADAEVFIARHHGPSN